MEHEFTLIIANDLAVDPEFTDPDSPGFLSLQNDQRSSGRLARQRITPHAAPLKGRNGNRRRRIPRPTALLEAGWRSPPLMGRGRGGVCNFISESLIVCSSLSESLIVCVLSAEKVRDPTPAPASPHRRYAPQLLPTRNCLEGRGKATAGEEFLGQLLYNCLK